MIKKTYRIIVVQMVLMVVGIFYCSVVLAKDQHIKILSMDNRGLSIELSVPHFELKDVAVDDRSFQRIDIDGWARTAEAGQPELPVKGMLIEVPESGKIEIEVIDGTYETISDCQICPVSKRIISDNGEVTREFVYDYDGRDSLGFFPQTLAEVGARSILRDVAVARLKIFPFQWNPETKELRYYTKFKIKIKFEETLPKEISGNAVEENIFDKIKEGTIINYRKREKIARNSFVKQDDSTGPDKESLRIEVKEDGIYRLTFDDMKDAGLDSKEIKAIDPSTFQLFNEENELAVKVDLRFTRLGKFTRGSFIEFYGKGIDNFFTDTNVYWLQWEGVETGKRIEEVSGEVTGNGEKVDSFNESLSFEENHVNWGLTPGAPDLDSWFWEKLTAPSTDEFEIEIPSIASTQTEATILVEYQGRSTALPDPNHHTLISLNGELMDDKFWNGDFQHIQAFSISNDLLNEGSNTISIESPGDTGASVDVIYLNNIEIEYSRRLEAEEDSLTFGLSGEPDPILGVILEERIIEAEINKLSDRDIMIYDVTDPFNVIEVVGFSVSGKGSDNNATFETVVLDEKSFSCYNKR